MGAASRGIQIKGLQLRGAGAVPGGRAAQQLGPAPREAAPLCVWGSPVSGGVQWEPRNPGWCRSPSPCRATSRQAHVGVLGPPHSQEGPCPPGG